MNDVIGPSSMIIRSAHYRRHKKKESLTHCTKKMSLRRIKGKSMMPSNNLFNVDNSINLTGLLGR